VCRPIEFAEMLRLLRLCTAVEIWSALNRAHLRNGGSQMRELGLGLVQDSSFLICVICVMRMRSLPKDLSADYADGTDRKLNLER